MNQNEMKALRMNDKRANVVKTLSKRLAPLAELTLKGIVAPEQAKDGGYVIAYRNRIKRNTAYAMLASMGAEEAVLKAIGGLHAEGKAALICSVLHDVTGGRLYCPAGVKARAEEYVKALAREDYMATWHNLSIGRDLAYTVKYANIKLTAAESATATANERAAKAEKNEAQSRVVRDSVLADIKTATALAARDRGEEIAALQAEVEDEEVA